MDAYRGTINVAADPRRFTLKCASTRWVSSCLLSGSHPICLLNFTRIIFLWPSHPVIPESKIARKPQPFVNVCVFNRNSRGWFPACDMSRLVKTTDSMSVSQDLSIATFKKMTFRYYQLQITLKSVELKSFQAKKTLGRHSKLFKNSSILVKMFKTNWHNTHPPIFFLSTQKWGGSTMSSPWGSTSHGKTPTRLQTSNADVVDMRSNA